MRLWQHGSGFRRRKEAIAALLTLVLVVLLVAYLLTSSFGRPARPARPHRRTPALVILTFDRSRK